MSRGELIDLLEAGFTAAGLSQWAARRTAEYFADDPAALGNLAHQIAAQLDRDGLPITVWVPASLVRAAAP
jgi:hypothetical protein